MSEEQNPGILVVALGEDFSDEKCGACERLAEFCVQQVKAEVTGEEGENFDGSDYLEAYVFESDIECLEAQLLCRQCAAKAAVVYFNVFSGG